MNIEDYAKIGPQYYNGEMFPTLEKYIQLIEYKSILDCGCGDGKTIYAMKIRGFLDNKEVYAFDLSPSRVDIVKKIDQNINVFVDDVEVMSKVKDASIDFLISEQVIEHVADPARMLANMERVTRKGGIIYLSTVFKKWYGWYFHRNKGKWVLDPTHLREYENESELFDLINKDKFEILENKKTLLLYPIIDVFVRILRIKNRLLSNNKFLNFLRKIKRPIFGYYYWEIVLIKK